MDFRDRIIIGVVRGGKGYLAPRSLSAGSSILKSLRDSATVLDIFIDDQGVWHLAGVPRHQAEIIDHTDVIISVIPQATAFRDDMFHSGIFEHVPSVGMGTASSALLARIPALYEALERGGVRTPRSRVIDATRFADRDGRQDLVQEIFRAFPLPVVLRPVLDEMPDEMPVEPIKDFEGIRRVLDMYGEDVLHEGLVVEEYARGKRLTVFIVDGLRGEASYVVPPVPTFIAQGDRTPVSTAESQTAQGVARMAYDALDINGFARIDMVLGSGGVIVIGVYTMPDISEWSPIHEALAGVGVAEKELLTHLVARALDAKLQ